MDPLITALCIVWILGGINVWADIKETENLSVSCNGIFVFIGFILVMTIWPIHFLFREKNEKD